ncbi:MAG: ABC transporter substrate-binding protein [Firmicutes bacterium]|nr:ABC transporter substrate-binding protein [Bacillota bacterium]
MSKGTLRTLLAAALALGLLAGCGSPQGSSQGGSGGDGKVIKIGFIAPLTGDVKTFGESARNGFRLALEEAGYKAGEFTIEVVEADDRNDPTEGKNVATRLITQDGVKAIVGSITSKVTIPIAELANERGVVMITPTATSPKVTVDDKGNRWEFVFRACFIDPFQGTVMAKFAAEKLGAKTAAVLYDKGNDYSVGLAESFRQHFEAGGGEVVAWEAYALTDTDFSAILTKVAQANPDVIYLPDYYQKVSLIGKQARERGITAPFLGGDGWDSPELDYATMAGGYFTNHYSSQDTREAVQNFVAAYEKKYGQKPESFGALGYDATRLLLKAIEEAGSDDPAKIREALQSIKDFPAVSGNISFDENGNPIKAAAILQVQPDKTFKYIDAILP